jgi:hypothetical protein
MVMSRNPETLKKKLPQWNFASHLHAVPSLRKPSSSSDPCLLGFREFARELARLFTAEFAFEDGAEAFRERALRDTVLPLSRACRRRSCILVVIVGFCGLCSIHEKEKGSAPGEGCKR